MTLPLASLVIATLAQYGLHERPGSGDDHAFLRTKAPHMRLANHASVYRVTATTFRTAGVTDIKVGTQLLRHRAAARLLRPAAVGLLGWERAP